MKKIFTFITMMVASAMMFMSCDNIEKDAEKGMKDLFQLTHKTDSVSITDSEMLVKTDSCVVFTFTGRVVNDTIDVTDKFVYMYSILKFDSKNSEEKVERKFHALFTDHEDDVIKAQGVKDVITKIKKFKDDPEINSSVASLVFLFGVEVGTNESFMGRFETDDVKSDSTAVKSDTIQ